MQSHLDEGDDPESVSGGSATEGGERERAAAVCEHCGSCHVVRVRADGSVRVIGTNGTCECGGNDYRVLGAPRKRRDPAADGDGPAGEATEI